MKKGDTVQVKASREVGDISGVDGRYYLVNINGCECGYYTSSDLNLIKSKEVPKPTTGGKIEYNKVLDILTSIDKRLSKLENSEEE